MTLDTLFDRVLEIQSKYPGATGKLSTIIDRIGIAVKLTANDLNRSRMAETITLEEGVNPSGEIAKWLDNKASRNFEKALASSGLCSVLISEELGGPQIIEGSEEGEYVVAFDPLDGSSNLDCNVTVGSIFGIWRRVSESGKPTDEDILRSGRDLIAAGYVMYGPSTVMVYASEGTIDEFTLDPSVGVFYLSKPDIRISGRGKTFSVNDARRHHWKPYVREFLDWLHSEEYSGVGKLASARHVGSLIADVHRTLIKGGVHMYPAGEDLPEGKIRLMYEAAPLAWMMERAGGKAVTGTGEHILDKVPTSVHQRCPIILGSHFEVDKFEELRLKWESEHPAERKHTSPKTTEKGPKFPLG
jgi:fructose-1,6-bisphosphatase I